MNFDLIISCHFVCIFVCFLTVSEPRPMPSCVARVGGSGNNATAAVHWKTSFTQEIIICTNTRVLLGTHILPQSRARGEATF